MRHSRSMAQHCRGSGTAPAAAALEGEVRRPTPLGTALYYLETLLLNTLPEAPAAASDPGRAGKYFCRSQDLL